MFWFRKRQLVIPGTMNVERTALPWESESATSAHLLSMVTNSASESCHTNNRTILSQSFTKIHLAIKQSGPMKDKIGSFPTESADRGDDFCKYGLDRYAGFMTSAGSKELALMRSWRPGPITELENKQRT
jgi:hypothetical protein